MGACLKEHPRAFRDQSPPWDLDFECEGRVSEVLPGLDLEDSAIQPREQGWGTPEFVLLLLILL